MAPAPDLHISDAQEASETPFLDLAIEADGWAALDGSPQDVFERAATAALEALAITPTAVSISALLTNDAEMRGLNQRFRDIDAPTNVLSWPARQLDGPLDAQAVRAGACAQERRFLGDIALGLETVAAEAAAAKITFDAHTAHLIVHAVLHLCGYDHDMDDDAATMMRREIDALARLGIANPYPNGPDDDDGSFESADGKRNDER